LRKKIQQARPIRLNRFGSVQVKLEMRARRRIHARDKKVNVGRRIPVAVTGLMMLTTLARATDGIRHLSKEFNGRGLALGVTRPMHPQPPGDPVAIRERTGRVLLQGVWLEFS